LRFIIVPEPVEGGGLGGHEGGTERLHEPCLVVGTRSARVDGGLEARVCEHQSAQEAYGAGAQHHRSMTAARLPVRHARACPRQALLNLPGLGDRLLGNGERLCQHRYLTQFTRHDAHGRLVVHHELGRKAVRSLDPALCEVSRVAEVLPPDRTGETPGVWARPPHHRDHEVAWLDPGDTRPHLDDLAEGLVTQHQVLRARWWHAVLESDDLAVRAANPDLQHAELDLGG
jgi:hypothetical protein